MTKRLRLGVVIRVMGAASEPGLLRECAQAADRAGIDDLWVVDHIAIPPDDSEGSTVATWTRSPPLLTSPRQQSGSGSAPAYSYSRTVHRSPRPRLWPPSRSCPTAGFPWESASAG